MSTYCRTCHKALSSAGSTDKPTEVVWFHSGEADHKAAPVEHSHSGTYCWTATTCEAYTALAKLREFAADKNDPDLDALIAQVEAALPELVAN
jgi:hypothetical protein